MTGFAGVKVEHGKLCDARNKPSLAVGTLRVHSLALRHFSFSTVNKMEAYLTTVLESLIPAQAIKDTPEAGPCDCSS